MADATVSPRAHAAPGTPYINLSSNMQAFFERRGMWRAGKPCGVLATWLGERCPWNLPWDAVAHWIVPARLDALIADADGAPIQAWTSTRQRAQWLRRLREAGVRAGGVRAATAVSARRAGTDPLTPLNPLAGPLVIPTDGRARKAFEQHVMTTLREFVVFTQGSAYAEGEQA